MSTLSELIAAVLAAADQIEGELPRLASATEAIRAHAEVVDALIGDSSSGSDVDIRGSLGAAEQRVAAAAERVQIARDGVRDWLAQHGGTLHDALARHEQLLPPRAPRQVSPHAPTIRNPMDAMADVFNARADDRPGRGGFGHGYSRHVRPFEVDAPTAHASLQARLGYRTDADGQPKVYSTNSRHAGLLKPPAGKVRMASQFDNPDDGAAVRRYFEMHRDEFTGDTTSIPIATILGRNGHKRCTGFYVNPADPSTYCEIDFEGGSILFVNRTNDSGREYVTAYPEPAAGRHP